jgi:hypothetical protein
MSQLDVIWSTLAKARGTRDDARAQHRDAVLKLRDLDAQIASLQRLAAFDGGARQRLEELQRQRANQAQAIVDASAVLGKAAAAARDDAISLLDVSPQQLVNGLSDDTPFLLLPLRLETRFGIEDGRRVLRIRMFPDDIATVQHEKALTQAELRGGLAYWQTLIATKRRSAARGTSSRTVTAAIAPAGSRAPRNRPTGATRSPIRRKRNSRRPT